MTPTIQATQKELIEGFRAAFVDVADKDVYEACIPPFVAMLALNNSLPEKLDGPTLVKHCLDHRDDPQVKVVMGLALVLLAKMSELALLEIISDRQSALNN